MDQIDTLRISSNPYDFIRIKLTWCLWNDLVFMNPYRIQHIYWYLWDENWCLWNLVGLTRPSDDLAATDSPHVEPEAFQGS